MLSSIAITCWAAFASPMAGSLLSTCPQGTPQDSPAGKRAEKQRAKVAYLKVEAVTPTFEPLPGVTVTAAYTGGTARGITGSDGVAIVPVAAGLFIDWSVQAPLSGDSTWGNFAGLEPDQTVSLCPVLNGTLDTSVLVRFVELSSGRGLPGVLLERVLPLEGEHGETAAAAPHPSPFTFPVHFPAASGPRGWMRVPAATWRSVAYVASAPGFADSYVEILSKDTSVEHGGTLSAVLVPESTMTVETIGLPPGATVRASAWLDDPPPGGRHVSEPTVKGTWEVLPDPLGHASFGNLPPHSEVELSVMLGRAQLQAIDPVRTGPSGTRARSSIDLRPQCQISGRVLDPLGDPVPGQALALSRCPLRDLESPPRPRMLFGVTQTDAQGRFKMESLTAGWYVLFLTQTREGRLTPLYGTAAWVVDTPLIEVTHNAPSATLDIRLDPGISAHGILHDSSGTPTGGTVKISDQRRTYEVEIGPNGRFSLGPFPEGARLYIAGIQDSGGRRLKTGMVKSIASRDPLMLHFRGKDELGFKPR